MLRNRLFFVLGLLVVASMILSACGAPAPAATEAPAVATEAPAVATEAPVVPTEAPITPTSYTTPHPILGDLKVRQALSYCTNKNDLIKSVYPLLSEEEQGKLVMHTFIPTSHWAYAGDENVTIYEYDPAKGAALLDEAGWTLAEGAGFRTNAAGDELALKFTTTSAAFRQTWAAIWEAQMAECGVRVVRLHAPASWWFGDTTGLARRDFELGAFAWVGQADPGGQTLYACDQIPLPENGWAGQNSMGWCNEEASKNIKLANNTLIKDERIAAYTVVQNEFTKDVPSIPLFNRTDTFASAADLAGFAPTPGQEYYMYNAGDWERPGQDTIILGFTQEPASLYTLVESAFVAVAADYFLRPGFTTSLNYDYAPVYLKSLPTLESGATTNNDVEVAEGAKVVDADGNVVDLAAGVKVINAAGETVEYTGGTVTMKQLVSKFEFIDGIKWEDGEPIKAADFELSKTIACDPESGATSFITCDKTASVEFADNGYTQTWIPGVQDPLYFIPVWGLEPSHQVLADGRNLKDVPASEWATIPEVAEDPLSYGPYVLTEWVKGEKMVFAANPNWVFGAPKTPNLVIQIISAEGAEAALLGGEVDVLDSTTLVGLTQTLVDAATAGTIKTIINASATWEHIDVNLFLR
ncbi:ABC transporter substrate-binding protein [Candidatus Villigracilis saccharophilus]|uniref:ABC transporter substrate-binding protein n=1 Tax=Candidatus Villigracilis saccharophilus TaxID=3140684 RepID=UPI003136DDF4|nr:peptide ABC transporter substrate-binding protein [Anaerolineales bacterium]